MGTGPRSSEQSETATITGVLELGPFITIEGVDGSGKTTQLHYLAERLRTAGERVTVTREPGGTALGDGLRRLLLEPSPEPIAPAAELAMMFAARAQNCARIIEPARQRGEWVLCDRFSDASLAYQGAGRGIDSNTIRQLHELLVPSCYPDLTLILDVELSTSLKRARARLVRSGSQEGRFEAEGAAFFERVRAAYLELARREPERCRLIESAAPEQQVAERIWHEVEAFAATRRQSVRGQAQ